MVYTVIVYMCIYACAGVWLLGACAHAVVYTAHALHAPLRASDFIASAHAMRSRPRIVIANDRMRKSCPSLDQTIAAALLSVPTEGVVERNLAPQWAEKPLQWAEKPPQGAEGGRPAPQNEGGGVGSRLEEDLDLEATMLSLSALRGGMRHCLSTTPPLDPPRQALLTRLLLHLHNEAVNKELNGTEG